MKIVFIFLTLILIVLFFAYGYFSSKSFLSTEVDFGHVIFCVLLGFFPGWLFTEAGIKKVAHKISKNFLWSATFFWGVAVIYGWLIGWSGVNIETLNYFIKYIEFETIHTFSLSSIYLGILFSVIRK